MPGRHVHPDFFPFSKGGQFRDADNMDQRTAAQFHEIADLATHVAAVFDRTIKCVHVGFWWCFIGIREFKFLSAYDQFDRLTICPIPRVFYAEFISVLHLDADHFTI